MAFTSFLLKGLLFLAAVSPTMSARIAGMTTSARIGGHSKEVSVSHPVHILLTRHGISCANVVSNWVGSMLGSMNHIYMKDPLLCKAGAHFCEVARDKVPPRLKELGLPPPDAVLSSVLARAVQTAVLQFPGYPIYVVPHIRESGFGADNKHNVSDVQVEKLRRELGDSWSINYQYANALGFQHEGDWQEFRHFLQHTFLPDFLRTSNKSSGEPIVLAVTSHSNFMNEGEVYEKCQEHYQRFYKKRAENNQVVKLSYTFTETVPDGGVDVTPVRSLATDEQPCVNVVDGIAYKDEAGNMAPLCKSDIGPTCWEHIKAEGGQSYPKTVEDKIRSMQKRFQKYQKDIYRSMQNNKPKDPDQGQKASKLQSEISQLENTECWSGGLPKPLASEP